MLENIEEIAYNRHIGEFMKKRRYQNKNKSILLRGNMLAGIFLAIVMASLAIGTYMAVSNEQEKMARYVEKESALDAQIAEEESKAAQLESEKDSMNSREYIEKIAKEKLNLVYPDEIILKPEEKGN